MNGFGSRRRALFAPVCAFAFLFLTLAGPLAAQVGSGKLTGIVTDQQTGEPLAGAQVYIEDLGRGTLTQDNGRFFIISVAPGTYTVAAQLIGYATVQRQNVQISINATRTVNFRMPSEAVAVEEIVVEAERVPLIETSASGSGDVVTEAELNALPVADIGEALSLQQGFLQVPQNTDVVSFLDQNRGLTPVRIRGGRSGQSITMIDGIPINNFMLGGRSFFPPRLIVEQIDYARGGFDAKYGNALSGVVNIKTREPRTRLQGSIQYQTSALGGALGSEYDDLRGYQHLEGYASGPVPGTDNNLRFVIAARDRDEADRVLAFDNDVMNPVDLTRNQRGNFASAYDLIPGWRATGFDHERDAFGKLSYYFSPAAKLSVAAIDYSRQRQPYQFRWLQVGYDLYGQCVSLYPNLEDVCDRYYRSGVDPQQLTDLRRTTQERQYVLRNSINLDRRLYWANWEHTVGGRLAYSFAAGKFDQSRETCIFLSGVCLGERIASNWSNGPFEGSGGDKNFGRHPLFGSDDYFGRDGAESNFARADIEWQATDHHNLSAGLFWQQHDISFLEGRDVGLNNVQIEWNEYTGEPWDAAAYVQDEMEYDFITVRLGFRFDYGRASGLFFADPQDPTNGTTAFEVCENPGSFGLNPSDFEYTDPATGETFTGITACGLNAELINSAVETAMQDDFVEAKARRQFSPRLGVSFPVTENSNLFFNYGRYSQNPILHNLYRMTGIGTEREGTRRALDFVTNATSVPLLGNPNLLTEQAASYELGYLADFGNNYALSTILFSHDQFGLTGVRPGGVRDGLLVFDAGSTYGSSTYEYSVLLNLDYQTSRGIEVSLRRRVANYWGFDLRYSYSRVRTNAAPPELEQQKRGEERDDLVRREIRSEVDQPHRLSGSLRFTVGEDTPEIPFGDLLRNTTLSSTLRLSSGLPYTPQLTGSGFSGRLTRNSGTSPAVFRVDLLARKNFQHANLKYGAFVRITNLLNRTNCLQVFPSTGRCDSGSITESRLYTGGVSLLNTISQAWDRADYVYAPRSINAGLQISF